MHIDQLLDQYGYWALFLGVFFEGPITLSLAGFLSHQGYLNIIGVLLTAFVATFIVVEMFFFTGMVAGRSLLDKWPVWRKNSNRFAALLERHKTLFILAFRFVYGAQTIAPMVMGTGKMSSGSFSILNAAGAAIWTICFFIAGYVFGHAFETLIDDVKLYEKPISLVLVAVALVYYLARRLVWRRVPSGDRR